MQKLMEEQQAALKKSQDEITQHMAAVKAKSGDTSGELAAAQKAENDLEKITAKHKADMEAAEQKHAQQFEELQTKMEELSTREADQSAAQEAAAKALKQQEEMDALKAQLLSLQKTTTPETPTPDPQVAILTAQIEKLMEAQKNQEPVKFVSTPVVPTTTTPEGEENGEKPMVEEIK